MIISFNLKAWLIIHYRDKAARKTDSKSVEPTTEQELGKNLVWLMIDFYDQGKIIQR